MRGDGSSPGSIGGRRVLLADSDPEVQQTVRLVAARHGHEIILAKTGTEALAQAVASSPDVIVLDTLFPDLDGRDVLARLKGDSRTAHIPVVVWSGGREERQSDRRIALDLGADDYVDMVNAQLLMRRLERLLRRLSRSSEATVRPR
jgi:two-component system KDP operon response regulator KdpE